MVGPLVWIVAVLAVLVLLLLYRVYYATQCRTGTVEIMCWPVDKTSKACGDINNAPSGGSHRTHLQQVSFGSALPCVPKQVSLSAVRLDMGTTGARYALEAKNVTREGFTLQVTTWGSTNIYSLNVQWCAVCA